MREIGIIVVAHQEIERQLQKHGPRYVRLSDAKSRVDVLDDADASRGPARSTW